MKNILFLVAFSACLPLGINFNISAANTQVKHFKVTINNNATHVDLTKIMITPTFTKSGSNEPICPPIIVNGPFTQKTQTAYGQCMAYNQLNSSCNCFKDAHVQIIGTQFPGIVNSTALSDDRRMWSQLKLQGTKALVANIEIRDMGDELTIDITDDYINLKAHTFQDTLNIPNMTLKLTTVDIMNIDPEEQKRSWKQYPQSAVDTIFYSDGNERIFSLGDQKLSAEEEGKKTVRIKKAFLPEKTSIAFKNSTQTPIQFWLFCPSYGEYGHIKTTWQTDRTGTPLTVDNSITAPITINAGQTQKISFGKYCALAKISTKNSTQTFIDEIYKTNLDTELALSQLPTSGTSLGQDGDVVYEIKSTDKGGFTFIKNDSKKGPTSMAFAKLLNITNTTKDEVLLMLSCSHANDTSPSTELIIKPDELKNITLKSGCQIKSIATKKPTYSKWKTMRVYESVADPQAPLAIVDAQIFSYDTILQDEYTIGNDYQLESIK